MKFMRLGSKTDNFQSVGNIRSVCSEIASDFTIVVDGITFYVHKFPLLCKSAKLQKLAHAENSCAVHLDGFPGGVQAFEICVRFCYGVKVIVNAYNVVSVRCAAEYLEMTEGAEKGNLILKVDSFLNSYILRGWKDSIIAYKSTKALLPLAGELQIVSKCMRSIVSKLLTSPAKVDWSFTQTRTCKARENDRSEITQSPPWNGKQSEPVNANWWIEDIAELEIDMYSDVILAVKATGQMPSRLIGDSLEFYTMKCLPFIDKGYHFDDMSNAANERQHLERIICLLPAEKGCVSCRFLLNILKAASFLGVSISLRHQLIRRAGLQLEEASISDLLIPCSSKPTDSLYDVELAQSIIEEFMMQYQSPPISPTHENRKYEKRRTRSAENINVVNSRRSSSATHGSKLRVAKLVDGYLAEISRDENLEISKFIALAKSIPDFARPTHDGLYRAIDVYLKKHPGVSKNERKKLCRLLDCRKLSMDACMHASQNERLPLRTVVQVLFFEQARNAANGGVCLTDLPSGVKALMAVQESSDSHEGTSGGHDDKWEEVQQNFEALQRDLASIKVKLSEVEKEQSIMEQDSARSHSSSKTKKFLSRIWPGRSFADHGSNFKSCVRC